MRRQQALYLPETGIVHALGEMLAYDDMERHAAIAALAIISRPVSGALSTRTV